MIELTKYKIYIGWYSNDEPYSQLQILVKNDEEGNKLKQQILDDYQKARKFDEIKDGTLGFIRAFNWLEKNEIQKIPQLEAEIKQLKIEKENLESELMEAPIHE